jgi:hypothetical protein
MSFHFTIAILNIQNMLLNSTIIASTEVLAAAAATCTEKVPLVLLFDCSLSRMNGIGWSEEGRKGEGRKEEGNTCNEREF